MMHGRGKSDSAIVAVKPTNKVARPAAEQSAVEQTAAEPVEPRAETKGNADWQSTHWTLSRASVSQALERMRQTIAVGTRGRSRMRESCTYGSVRGALSNERPYRNALPSSPSSAARRRPCRWRRGRSSRGCQ
jgi:hypothetical protein